MNKLVYGIDPAMDEDNCSTAIAMVRLDKKTKVVVFVDEYSTILKNLSFKIPIEGNEFKKKLKKTISLLDNKGNIKIPNLKYKLMTSNRMLLIVFRDALEKRRAECVIRHFVLEQNRQAGEKFCEVMKKYHEQLDNQKPKLKPNHQRFVYDWRKDKRRR